MVNIIKGSLFDSRCEVWVNTVNCVGIMGKGIALEFKKRFPEMFLDYQKICKANFLKPGKSLWWQDLRTNQKIINIATKDHWRNPSKIEWIHIGVKTIEEHIRLLKIKSIAIPALGCSNGGLNWDDVRPIIVQGLQDLDCYIELYEPL